MKILLALVSTAVFTFHVFQPSAKAPTALIIRYIGSVDKPIYPVLISTPNMNRDQRSLLESKYFTRSQFSSFVVASEVLWSLVSTVEHYGDPGAYNCARSRNLQITELEPNGVETKLCIPPDKALRFLPIAITEVRSDRELTETLQYMQARMEAYEQKM